MEKKKKKIKSITFGKKKFMKKNTSNKTTNFLASLMNLTSVQRITNL